MLSRQRINALVHCVNYLNQTGRLTDAYELCNYLDDEGVAMFWFNGCCIVNWATSHYVDVH